MRAHDRPACHCPRAARLGTAAVHVLLADGRGDGAFGSERVVWLAARVRAALWARVVRRAALRAVGAIWVLVPMLTADCISRERREGTLGLLFLTPLKGTDVVVAKGLAHGLRAMTLGLAVLPVLTIPFLLGGVSWAEAVMSVMLNANAMCWALAAGLLASAWSKAWLRAMLTGRHPGLWFVRPLGRRDRLDSDAGSFGGARWERIEWDWGPAFATGFAFATNAEGCWSGFTRWAPLSADYK